jgi:hypothetical protein
MWRRRRRRRRGRMRSNLYSPTKGSHELVKGQPLCVLPHDGGRGVELVEDQVDGDEVEVVAHQLAVPRVGLVGYHFSLHVILCSRKYGSIDDSRYGPCEQPSHTREYTTLAGQGLQKRMPLMTAGMVHVNTPRE